MSDVTSAPLPRGLGGDLTAAELEEHAGVMPFGRSQVIAILFGLASIVLLIFVAPSLDSTPRTFAFEPPPDPVQVTFNPVRLVQAVAALWLVVAAATLALPRIRSRGVHIAVRVGQALGAITVIPL